MCACVHCSFSIEQAHRWGINVHYARQLWFTISTSLKQYLSLLYPVIERYLCLHQGFCEWYCPAPMNNRDVIRNSANTVTAGFRFPSAATWKQRVEKRDELRDQTARTAPAKWVDEIWNRGLFLNRLVTSSGRGYEFRKSSIWITRRKSALRFSWFFW